MFVTYWMYGLNGEFGMLSLPYQAMTSLLGEKSHYLIGYMEAALGAGSKRPKFIE